MINKSSVTNLIALIVSLIGIVFAEEHIKSIGFYALSGAITNWLAIIMLFDKIPFIYGSGIIPKQFESFKRAIKNMIIKQFFHHDQIEKFLLKSFEFDPKILQSKIAKLIDYDLLFDRFVETIMASSFGGMIQSFLGGKEAIEPMRESFKEKMSKAFEEMLSKPEMQENITAILQSFDSKIISDKVEVMIDNRLDELTPEMVKKIIQEMIRKHLGWLVIWGGVFGGILGLIASFM
ncbi:DUF445 family protein [Fangia hongkongensis]|uniref:DUF445 family protein n=2 Tax=Fangia hongkongensis TaxID=270495 RepID=UPI00037E47A4|nr:DUF445 family protein [Fangia hongkongensis]